MPTRAAPGRRAARPRAAWWLAACLTVALTSATGAAADEPTAAAAPPAPTRAAPIPLAEVSQRSGDLAAYLKQLEERLALGDDVAAIERAVPDLAERIRALRTDTLRTLAASPALREVDEGLSQWQGLQDTLSEAAATVTAKLTEIDAELDGLAELRAIWEATADAAQATGAPPTLLDRIRVSLGMIEQTRKQIETSRGRLLVLQDRIVREVGRCRDAIERLNAYRRTAVDRLLVRDAQPIWARELWSANWTEAMTAYRDQLRDAAQATRDYLRVQLPRVPFQLALFVVLVVVWRRARQRTARWLEEDDSLASIAAVFEHTVSSALFLTLLLTPRFYPAMPLLLKLGVRVAAIPFLLRVLDRLVDPPILPGLYALGIFFVVDQVRALVGPLPLVEQLLFVLEMLAGVVVLAWMLRSGRIARLRAHLSPRVVALLERALLALMALFAVALLAAALGFMQLARVVAGAVLGSGYAAMLLFAIQRFAQGVWAYALRSQTLRRARMVQHHRALLQARGERALSWIAAALWILAMLASLELLRPARAALHRAVTATFAVGAFSISLGEVLAFAAAVWLSFLLSRFLRFLFEEEVYPRVPLPRGMPYTLSTILHYTVLLVGLVVGLAAGGLRLDRFALLAGAFGVGIGFGLQNVVNNFVSGLILLFERPLQVGDTVQIGAISGEIRRIGIRSSTVRTFEGAEVIVPNATLIADPVTNWTLTDRMRRIDLPVSVAYGSDPEQVLELLRSVAKAHSLVVAAPAPTAIFMGFGEASLNFELRVWTDHFERWVMTRSELAIAVYKSLSESGIAIPVVPREPYRGERPDRPEVDASEPATIGTSDAMRDER